MAIQFRMLALTALLVTGGARGMTDYQKQQADKYKNQQIKETEELLGQIRQQLFVVESGIQAITNDPNYRRVTTGIEQQQGEITRAQQELAAANKAIQEAQSKIDAANVVGVATLSQDDQAVIANFQANMPALNNRALRAQQDVDAANSSITDYKKEELLNKLTISVQQQDTLLGQLKDNQNKLADLRTKKVINPVSEDERSKLIGRQRQSQQQNNNNNDQQPPVVPPAQSKFSTKQKQILAGLGTAAGVAVAAGMLYVGLRWYQKKQISKVVARHGKMQDDFSFQERDMMAAAVLASTGVPGSMSYLKREASRYDVGSELIPTYLMWQILADIYYKQPANQAMIDQLKAKLGAL